MTKVVGALEALLLLAAIALYCWCLAELNAQ